CGGMGLVRPVAKPCCRTWCLAWNFPCSSTFDRRSRVRIVRTEKSDMIIPSRHYFGPVSSWPYAILRYVEPGLLVDVGAATGTTVKHMADESPRSEIMAYEPFPGNWPHFERTTAGIQNCVLLKKAASDCEGNA